MISIHSTCSFETALKKNKTKFNWVCNQSKLVLTVLQFKYILHFQTIKNFFFLLNTFKFSNWVWVRAILLIIGFKCLAFEIALLRWDIPRNLHKQQHHHHLYCSTRSCPATLRRHLFIVYIFVDIHFFFNFSSSVSVGP